MNNYNENQQLNKNETILSKEVYEFLISNLDKVTELYKEIGDLKETVGYLRGRLSISPSDNNLLGEGAVNNNSPSIIDSLNTSTQNHPIVEGEKENIINIDTENKNIETIIENSNDESVHISKDEVVEFDKLEKEIVNKNKVINNQLRKIGFWIFFVSTASIFLNLWIRKFVILTNELINLLGVFAPISTGGLITIIRPKGPGIIGWLLLVATSIVFILNYFEMIIIL